jgi:hypothetical protein
LLYGLTAAEIVSFIENWPFLVIPDVALLWEFAPHNGRLYQLLEKRCLPAIGDIAEKLLAVDECSDDFVSLLTGGFEILKQRRFLWKAAGICEAPGERMLAALRSVLNNDYREELLAAMEGPNFLGNVLQAGIDDISFAGFPASNGLCDDALALLLLCGCHLSPELTVRVFDGASSAIARAAAFDALSIDSWPFQDEQLRCALLFASRTGSISFAEKVARGSQVEFDEPLCLAVIFESVSSEQILPLLLERAAPSIMEEIIQQIVSDENIRVFGDRLSLKFKLNQMDETQSPAAFSAFLEELGPAECDEVDFSRIWEAFFLATSLLRTPETVRKFFGFLAAHPGHFCATALKLRSCDSSRIRPFVCSVFIPVLASIESVLRSEAGELRSVLATFRFSSMGAVASPPGFDSFDFDDILPLLAPQTVSKFLFLLDTNGEIGHHQSLLLRPSRSVREALATFLSFRTILRLPEVLVLEFTCIASSAIDVNDQLVVANTKYQLRSVVCSPDIVYLRTESQCFLCCRRGVYSYESDISGSISYLFYENQAVLPVGAAEIGKNLSPMAVNVARALHCPEIDWSAFERTSTFFETAIHLLSTFSIVSLFDSLKTSSEFAVLFFDRCSAQLNDSLFWSTFTSQIESLVSVHPDHSKLLRSLVEQGKGADRDMSVFIDSVINIFMFDSISGEALLACHSLICRDSRYRSSRLFPRFLSILLFERGLNLSGFFAEDDTTTNDLLRIALRVGDPRLKPYILPVRPFQVEVIAGYSTPPDFLQDLIQSDSSNVEFAIACTNVIATKPLLSHLAAMSHRPELRRSAHWLQGFLESQSADIRSDAARLLASLWPVDSDPDPSVGQLLSDLVVHPHIIWHYPLFDSYASWLPKNHDFANAILSVLWDPLVLPTAIPEYAALSDLLLRVHPPGMHAFAISFAMAAELTTCAEQQLPSRRPTVRSFSARDRQLFYTTVLSLYAKFPHLMTRAPDWVRASERTCMRLLLRTDITLDEMEALAASFLNALGFRTPEEMLCILGLFQFAPFLLARRISRIFVLPTFRDTGFLLLFTPILLKFIGEDFNRVAHGCAPDDLIRDTPAIILCAWATHLERVAERSNNWQSKSPSYDVAASEIFLFWARDHWGSTWVRGESTEVQLAWLQFLNCGCRLWVPFLGVAHKFFGENNLELFDSESREVRAAHTSFVFSVCSMEQESRMTGWIPYLCRVLAADLAHGATFADLSPVVGFLGTLLQARDRVRVSQWLSKVPEIFLLANGIETPADVQLAERFFASLFAASQETGLDVRAVAEVIASIAPEDAGKLAIVQMWLTSLGDRLLEQVPLAFDHFERMFYGVESPSALLCDVFDQMILISSRVYD